MRKLSYGCAIRPAVIARMIERATADVATDPREESYGNYQRF
jgi:hypothetical protein